MAISSQQVPIPADGSSVPVVSNDAANANQVRVRNTGTVTVSLGGSGTNVYPLLVNESISLVLGSDDALTAQVQAGTAGQITLLFAG